MIQITATDFKTNFGKYLSLAEHEDIFILKSGKTVAKLSGVKQDKVKDMESLFGILPWDGDDIDIRSVKAERLAKKHESLD